MAMKTGRVLGLAALAVAAGGLALVLFGCGGIPEGTTRVATVDSMQIEATGAGIVKADARKTTYRIKCGLCGYLSEGMTADTPTAGKPYTLDWVCPKCGHKQKIVIKVATP